MKKIVIGLAVISLFMLFLTTVRAQQEIFQSIDHIQVDDDIINITLSGETKYHAFKISNPPRLVVEFSNTEIKFPKKDIIPVDTSLIKRVRCGQFQDKPVKIARVVIDLEKMTEYSLQNFDNIVELKLESDGASSKNEGNTTPSVSTVKTPESQVVEANKEEPVIKKEVVKPIIPKKITKSKVTKKIPVKKKDLPTPVKEVKSIYMMTQPISIDFEDADIRDVFRILSMKSGVNIIYGPDVTGTITLRLDKVAFNKAFETILSLNELVSQEQSATIIRIATPQQITKERSQAVTFTKMFPLNYAKAEEVKSSLDAIRNAEGRKGNISVDSRTNSLIITDTPDGLLSLKKLLTEIDKKPQQVIIEAKIVEIVLTNAFDLGVQWQYANTLQNDPGALIAIGGTIAEVSANAAGSGAAIDATVVSPVSPGAGGTGVVFPASAVSGQMGAISFGIISNQTRLSGMLTALAQKGLSKILSNPKVTTINNKEAKIMVGQRIPYTTTTVNVSGSTQATEFIDVGIKLTVTPTINADKKITLKVHPEVSLYIRPDPAGPVIGTREAETTILVTSGETVVIGGLINEEDKKLGTQVPLLGDLPIIGHLFKRQYNTKERTELLVFITPQIIED